MKRRNILSLARGAAAFATVPALAGTALPQAEVFKSPYRGCCGAWVENTKAAGFDVKVPLVNDTTAARKRLGMPDAFGNCHTARSAGTSLRVISLHIFAALGLTIALGANAQTAPASAADHSAHHAATSAPTTDGEVRKIDREQGKVTLKHGPIANLEMPGMTMVFKVSDPKMLDSIKEGDKVKFTADKVNGAMTVTAIEAAK